MQEDKKNLKVALLLPTYKIGGAEKVFVELANNLCDHYDKVDMVTLSNEGPLKYDLKKLVGQVVLESQSYKVFLKKFIKYMNKECPDIIFTSVYATGLIAIAARFFSRHKPKIIVGCHNNFTYKVKRPDNIKDKYLLYPLSYALFRFADKILCVSHGVADDIRKKLKINKSLISVIYNPVVSVSIDQQAKKELLHPWFSSERNFTTILAVGRLVPQKGFDSLLQGIAIARNSVDIRLVIVGDGPEMNNLKEIARDLKIDSIVDFAGYEGNPYRYMYRADIFAMSSRWEGLGNTLIEALACGCFTISTDCMYGPREILDDGKYGMLVPVDDPAAMANALINIVSDPSKKTDKKELINRSNEFSVSASMGKYINLIDSTCGR